MAWYNYIIYDFNSKAFATPTKTEHKEFTQHDIHLFIEKQLSDAKYVEQCRKVGKSFYYFLEPISKDVEKVIVFKDGQFGQYYQLKDEDLDNLNKNASYDDNRVLTTRFEKAPDYKAPEQEKLF